MAIRPQTPHDFDWHKGTWNSGRTDEVAATVVITADWAPIRRFSSVIETDPTAVYGDLLPVLRQADLRITNLECPLTTEKNPVWKSGSELRGSPTHVRGLTSVPFDVVTLGNNHVFDYGAAGFDETIRLLDQHKIRWVGAGMTAEEAHRPLVVEINGVRVGIVNFSEGEDLTAAVDGPGVFGWDLERAIKNVETLKQHTHLVLVICHCGVEYIAFPPPYVADAFHRLADAGADLVIGHHPHVPQGIELYHGVPICYSLGNFVFYQETQLRYRKAGYAVEAQLSMGGLAGLGIIPYEIRSESLALMPDDKRRWFLDSLEQVSSPLKTRAMIESAWHGFLHHYGADGFKMEIAMLLERLSLNPPKGAAMFRNRVATMQHQRHWIDALTRMIDGTIDEAPDWAAELTRKWMTETQ